MELYNMWPLWLASFTYHVFKVYICCRMCQHFITLNNFSLYGYTVYCLFIRLLMDIWIISTCLLWITLLWTFRWYIIFIIRRKRYFLIGVQARESNNGKSLENNNIEPLLWEKKDNLLTYIFVKFLLSTAAFPVLC